MKQKAKKAASLAYQKSKFIKSEAKKHIGTAIAAAFAFIIALAWRDAIIDIVDSTIESLGITGETFYIKLLAALIVTIIAVIGIMITARLTAEQEEKTIEAEAKIQKK